MSDTIFNLPVVSQISPYISQRQLGELPILVISHPKVRAAVSLQGAQVLAWQPSGERAGLWLSDKNSFAAGETIRGGIPICWPWFGPINTPNHGFVRFLPWEFSAHNENNDGVILTLTLKDSDYTRKLWPHEFTLIAKIKFTTTCEIELEAHGEYQATAALHSYFNISDINRIDVTGVGKHYFDKLADRECYTDDEKLIFQGRTDRIYTEPAPTSVINDPVWQRSIEISHFDNSDVVCWNPGAEQSSGMKDMSREGYKNMVCVETALINKPMASSCEHPAHLSVVFKIIKNDA